MGYISDFLQLAFNPKALKAIGSFDTELRSAKGNMQRACEAFFHKAGIQVTLDRPWQISRAGILFVSDHSSALDGFALSLACPRELPIQRVIFLITGYVLGRHVAKNSVLVWPRGNYHNLVHETRGFVDRVAYLITHRWGPWVRPNRAIRKMCQTLAAGTSLCLLPSGTVSEPRWRSGIGAIIQASVRLRPRPNIPLYLAPVYIDWSKDRNRVAISAPGLISFDDLLDQAGENLSRTELTQWLKQQYENRLWKYSDLRIPTLDRAGHKSTPATLG